jgi:hypothetical protein
MERPQEQALRANIIGLSLAADKYALIYLSVQNQTFDFTYISSSRLEDRSN